MVFRDRRIKGGVHEGEGMVKLFYVVLQVFGRAE
jgi:hypothetical protein